MFEVAGKHTFFFPVDAAFEVKLLVSQGIKVIQITSNSSFI